MEKEIEQMIKLAYDLKPKEKAMKIVRGLIKVKEADNRLLKTIEDIKMRIENE